MFLQEVLINKPESEALAYQLPQFPDRTSLIHCLPFDVFIDHIFTLLCVEDILCLRRVNRAFFILTHEPIIWKRLLSHLPFPIPPIRPSSQYDLQDTNFEAEQLVSSAISLEKNWRKQHPYASSIIFDASYRVIEMKLLPGGKYLLASVQDAGLFYICIYYMDHPDGPRPLARMPTQTKASNLQARYMSFCEKPAIVAAFVRQTFPKTEPTKVDAPKSESQNKPIPSPDFPVNELVCVKVELCVLEPASNPGHPETSKILINPFTLIASAISRRPVEHISLYDLDGKPQVVMVQRPDRIVTIDLTTQITSWIVCTKHQDYNDKPHVIRAVRPLPYQNQFLVFRTIVVEPASHDKQITAVYMQILELYEAPPTGGRFADPKDVYVLGHQGVATVHISDYGIPTINKDSRDASFHYAPSPHISVYMETKNPSSIIHHVVWPTYQDKEQAKKTPFYNFDHVSFQTAHDSQPRTAHILPGCHRAFVYTTTARDRKDTLTLASLRRYINPEYETKDYPDSPVKRSCSIMRSRPQSMSVNAYGTIGGCSSAVRHYQKNGIGAITWDEGIGRVCIADGKTSHIEVVDFASVTDLDNKFERWKMVQKSVDRDKVYAKIGLPILSLILISISYLLDTTVV